MNPARDRYPNLSALARGVISHGLAESPALRSEAREVLDELDRAHQLVEDDDADPAANYLERAAIVVIIVLIVAWALGAMQLGGLRD
jgi:hypothetical protein